MPVGIISSRARALFRGRAGALTCMFCSMGGNRSNRWNRTWTRGEEPTSSRTDGPQALRAGGAHRPPPPLGQWGPVGPPNLPTVGWEVLYYFTGVLTTLHPVFDLYQTENTPRHNSSLCNTEGRVSYKYITYIHAYNIFPHPLSLSIVCL